MSFLHRACICKCIVYRILFKCIRSPQVHNSDTCDTCKYMLGEIQSLLVVWIHLLAALGVIWFCSYASAWDLHRACIGLHVQVQARTGTCICTCISLKSLHDFLAWYLHGICMVFAWELHAYASPMQIRKTTSGTCSSSPLRH